MFYLEKRIIKKNRFELIAGVDEAGRGPLAGPVVVAAVILKPECRNKPFLNKIEDSKKLTLKQRECAFKEITEKSWIGIGIADRELIDSLDIVSATNIAADFAIGNLRKKPELILTDAGINISFFIPHLSLINGESKSISIACASIVAKIIRDKIMEVYDHFFPHYGFGIHKGYGTEIHYKLIKKYGPSPIHRKKFSPIRDWFQG